MRISALHRYPLKGFSAERLGRVVLEAGGYFPADRLYAVENGPSRFDPGVPEHRPKISYLMLMRNEAIARLEARFNDADHELSIIHEGQVAARGNLTEAEGRATIERFLDSFVGEAEKRGPLRIVGGVDGFRFTDSPKGFVSLINLATVAELESRMGAPVDPLRFRANIHLEGLAPWAEFAMVGKSFTTSTGLRLAITKRIDRCAATAVDPATGQRDLPVVRALMDAYGHVDCGVYARIEAGGALAEGHRLMPVDEPESPHGAARF